MLQQNFILIKMIEAVYNHIHSIYIYRVTQKIAYGDYLLNRWSYKHPSNYENYTNQRTTLDDLMANGFESSYHWQVIREYDGGLS